MPTKKAQTKGKVVTDMQRDEMGRPVTAQQKKESLKGIQQSVDYPGRQYKKGGSVKGKTPTTPAQKKFASLAPPKNKITAADRIAGAKGAKPKMKMGGSCSTPKSLSKGK